MLYQYGVQTPLRVLDEIELWKRQESEHTVVIRQIAPDLEEQFVEELQNWEQDFAQTEGIAVRYIEAINRSLGIINPLLMQNIRKFVILAVNQSCSFVTFLNRLTAQSEAVRSNDIAVIVINHIRRESEYFIGIISAMPNHL
ncbi:MAG: DUF2935 domain-containing protein [Clostridia bacterium]|nr:DUF2935 domain-containing protein [Clostridia bacterium]